MFLYKKICVQPSVEQSHSHGKWLENRVELQVVVFRYLVRELDKCPFVVQYELLF